MLNFIKYSVEVAKIEAVLWYFGVTMVTMKFNANYTNWFKNAIRVIILDEYLYNYLHRDPLFE